MNDTPDRKSLRFGAFALLPAAGVSLTWFCCLPIAIGGFGLGAAALGNALVPYRPYFIAASLALLGLAFYKTYNPSPKDCVNSQCEATHGARSQQLVLWALSLAALALMTIDWWSSWVIYWLL